MKTKFDSNQQYPLDAINAVVDIFDGQPLATHSLEIHLGDRSELVLGNMLALGSKSILKNVRAVQVRNGFIQILERLKTLPAKSVDAKDKHFYNFSVELETGTEKIDIYLRTMFELERRYGFKKFIIVVPRAASRDVMLEGMPHSRRYFENLHGVKLAEVDAFVYNPKLPAQLFYFAINGFMQILIMNIQAFDKKNMAVIHKKNDRKLLGHKPIEFIQHTRPIVLIDEVQIMETETAKAAIASLNPLCTLWYSACERHPVAT